MSEAAVLTHLLETMPTLAPLLLLVWWLKGGNEKMVTQLNEERKERLDGMEKQITALEKRSDDCEKDRIALHRENASLREQMEGLRGSRVSKN